MALGSDMVSSFGLLPQPPAAIPWLMNALFTGEASCTKIRRICWSCPPAVIAATAGRGVAGIGTMCCLDYWHLRVGIHLFALGELSHSLLAPCANESAWKRVFFGVENIVLYIFRLYILLTSPGKLMKNPLRRFRLSPQHEGIFTTRAVQIPTINATMSAPLRFIRESTVLEVSQCVGNRCCPWFRC